MNESLAGALWGGGLNLAWEAGLLVATLLLLWPVPALLQRLLPWQSNLSPRDWRRLVQPPLMLLAVLVLRAVLQLLQPETPLLAVAVPLLLSMTLVQGLFYVLRRIVTPSALLHSLEHLVSWGIWGVLALHLTGHLEAIVAVLDAVGFQAGRQRISLYTAILGLLTVAVSLMLALWLARSLESRFIERMPVNANLKTALSKAAKTLLVLIAVLIALPVVGIDLTMLSVFGGALGVGIGLGLQKMVSNYFAGFTLLLDQSIRIGDMVTVNGYFGEVEDIRTRYTVIRGRDKTETIIPNEALVTSVVVNHTLEDRESRLQLRVQVAYDSDLEQVKAVMLAAANGHPRVIRPEDSHVRLVNFAESGIELSLVCWISDPENGLGRLKSDINWAIWEGFKRAGIEIPYPQRVVHLQSPSV